MSDLGERIIESLENFASQLKRGERIMVTTIERCGCDSGNLDIHTPPGIKPKCRICNGTGYIRYAKNWLPERETVDGDTN